MTASGDPNQSGEAVSDSVEADRAELVHEARKMIKRMRALARLLRYELGERELARVNGSLRAAGQRLAGARDAEVRLATLRRMRARHPKALALGGIERLSERLEREREHPEGHTQMAHGRQASEPADPQEVLDDIAEMREDLAQWSLVDHDFKAVAPGLGRIYREGRRRYARVQREHARDAEHVHDWRKRVKALYYALDMLGGAHAKGARNPTRRAERLGDLLGEEHDLWMLSAYVHAHPDACGQDVSAREALLKLVERRRERLRERALELGAQLYARKPRDFLRHVGVSLAR